MSEKWEAIAMGRNDETLRLQVPGGWIYLHRDLGPFESSPTALAMVFVPSPPSASIHIDADDLHQLSRGR